MNGRLIFAFADRLGLATVIARILLASFLVLLARTLVLLARFLLVTVVQSKQFTGSYNQFQKRRITSVGQLTSTSCASCFHDGVACDDGDACCRASRARRDVLPCLQ